MQRISPSGAVSTLADGINQPNDVALGPDGNIYATEWGNSRILRITPGGSVTRIADSPRPSSVAVGADGTVYVTEARRGAVRRITVAAFAAFKPARAGTAWTGLLASKRRPGAVTARNGVTTQAVVRETGRQEPLSPARRLPLLRTVAAPGRPAPCSVS